MKKNKSTNSTKKTTISQLINYGQKKQISIKDLKKIDSKEILINNTDLYKKTKNNESTLVSEQDLKTISLQKKQSTSKPRPKLDLSNINLKNKK